jgi:ribonuclease E
VDRLSQHTAETDVFAALRIDEQLTKALDRKVWLPSGGSLVIDRTEAMTVVDVNTGKFTGQGGNLEETVTRNNLEAAEELVRQLRLRDIGGMIVVDFIDMVLEGNRDLVLRRLTECLGRDRTKHQVAEVTSLGLVQMTRKRVGQGLLEAFSETCEHCKGRGLLIRQDPVERGRQQQPKSQPPKPTPPSGGPAVEEPAAEVSAPASTDEGVTDVTTEAESEPAAKAEPRPRRRRGRGKAAESPDGVAAEVTAEGAPEAVQAAAETDQRSDGAQLGREPWPAVPVPDVAPEAVVVPESSTEGVSAVGYSMPPVDSAEAANGSTPDTAPAGDGGAPPRRRRRAASRPAGPPVATA